MRLQSQMSRRSQRLRPVAVVMAHVMVWGAAMVAPHFVFADQSKPETRSCWQYLVDKFTGDSPALRQQGQSTLLGFLAQPTKEILLDTQDHGLAGAMAEVRNVILNMKPEEFNTIWDLVRRQDLDLLRKSHTKGQVELSDTQAARLSALIQFVEQDKHNVFWDKKALAWNALQTHYPHMRGPSHQNNIGGVIGGKDTSTITALEKSELIPAAQGRNSRIGRGTFWQRQREHPYYPLVDILAFNDQLRLRLEHVDALREATENERHDARDLKLNKSEENAIEEIFAEIGKLRRSTQQDVTTAYGQDLFTGGFQQHPEADLYKIAARIRGQKLIQEDWMGEFRLSAEKLMSRLEEILAAARKRQGQEPRKLSEYDLNELRIWNFAYLRESLVRHEEWDRVMSRDTGEDISITYEWKEWEKVGTRPVTKTDAQGKTYIEQEDVYDWVPKTATDTESLDYEDILVNRLERYSVGSSYSRGTITSVSGDEAVLRRSQRAAEQERPFYVSGQLLAKFDELAKTHNTLLLKKDSAQIEARRAEVSALIASIAGLIQQLDVYAKKSDQEIRAIWSADDPKDFRDRHAALLKFFAAKKVLLEIYLEQLARKDHELQIMAEVQDHSRELGALKLRAYTQMGLQITTGGAAVGLPAWYFLDPSFQAQVHSWVGDVSTAAQPLIELLSPLIGQ